MKPAITLVLLAIVAPTLRAQSGAPYVRPDAIADLRTDAGAALVSATWRYADARVVPVAHRLPGPDLKPSGPPSRTHDVEPRAGAPDFDDSTWETIPATSLEARRSTGRLAFGWYRTRVTVPERVGPFDPAGATVFLNVTVDDYAEVWVDGKLPEVPGQAGGHLVKGWNAPNRVLLTRHAKPGQQFQVAVFAANAPLSAPPANFVWVRSATLDFYSPHRARVGQPVETRITRLDPALDRLIPPGAQLERLATGFGFAEGPVWFPGDPGYLLFSDPNNNAIYRYSPGDGQISTFRTHSGYTGADIGNYHQPGSNGLALDSDGRLTVCEHGNRRVTRTERNGTVTVLADRYDGKRLNSPNDLTYRSDGTPFFTDPPFGLPDTFSDRRKELPFSGVYCVRNGALQLLTTELTGPNGLAFSPDEKQLYVSNWDPKRKVVLRFDVAADGSLANPTTFLDLTTAPGDEALDGLKVDGTGNVYVSGPGGVWIVSPQGKTLGRINGPELPANLAWGDADKQTLYLTARTGLYRLRLSDGDQP